MFTKGLVQEFIFDCQVRNLAPRTIRNYEKQLGFFITYLSDALGVEELEQLKPIHIKRFVVMNQERGCKPAYVNDLLKAVKCLCAYAYQEGYTDELITKAKKAFGVELPKNVAFKDIDKTAQFIIDEIITKNL